MASGLKLKDHDFYPAFDELLREGLPFGYALTFEAFAREAPEVQLPFVVRGAAGLRPARPELHAGLHVGPGRRLALDVEAEMDLQLRTQGTAGVGTAQHSLTLLKYDVKAMLTALLEVKADVRLPAGQRPHFSVSKRLDVGGRVSATYGPAFLPAPVGLVHGRMRGTVWDGKHWGLSNVKLDVVNVGVSVFRWSDSWRAGAGVSAITRRPLGHGGFEIGASAFMPGDEVKLLRKGDIPFAVYTWLKASF